MAVSIREFTVDINQPVSTVDLGSIGAGDRLGTRLSIHLFDGKQPLSLTSTQVVANVLRSDRNTVPMTGSVSGNTVTVNLEEAAMAVVGPVAFSVTCVNGDVKTTVLFGSYYVKKTTTDQIVDPGRKIPDITDLLQQIQRMEAASAAAESVVATFDSKYADVKADIEHLEDFSKTLGYGWKVAETNDFSKGMWQGGNWRTDGNYGKFLSTGAGHLVDLDELTVSVSAPVMTNLKLSIGIFGYNDEWLGSPTALNYIDISNGAYTIDPSIIKGYYSGAQKIAVMLSVYNGSTFENIPTGLTIAVRVMAGEDIVLRIDDIDNRLEKLERGDETVLVSNDEYVYGAYLNAAGYRTDGNYGMCKTHHNMIPVQNIRLIIDANDSYTYKYSIAYYDESRNFLQLPISNVDITDNVLDLTAAQIYARRSDVYFVRITVSILVNGSFVKVPETTKIRIISTSNGGYERFFVVDKDGNGDYTTINDAVAAIASSESKRCTIYVMPGVYKESVEIRGGKYISIIGANQNDCIIEAHSGQYIDAPIWTDGNFTIENLTLKMLVDEAPADWTPGTSQTDRKTMLPGYALHVDTGNNMAVDPQFGHKIGTVRNVVMYSEAFPACGTGLHTNQKLLFDNCTFIRNTTNQAYKQGGYDGAFLNHASTQSVTDNQQLEMRNCVCVCNYGASATLSYKQPGNENVTITMIGNTFWSDETNSPNVALVKNNAKLHGMSHGNNDNNLNAN